MARTLAGLIGATALAGCAGAPALQTREPISPPAPFQARAVLALSDLDMAATGYADRQLRQLPGQRDQLSVLRDFAGAAPQIAGVVASNSVVGWPGALALSPDQRFAYVVETQTEIDDSITEVADPYAAAPGRRVAAFDLQDPAAPKAIGGVDVCGDPASIDVHPSGAFALVACRDATTPLALVPLVNGAPQAARPLALAIPKAIQAEKNPGVSYARLSPDGRTLAINIANRHVVFADVSSTGDALPAQAQILGAPVSFNDGWLAMGRWSLDGRHMLIADTAWGPRGLDAALNGPGRIISIAFDPGGAHRVASEAKVSLSPEGFELDPAGALLAVVNMERTYLPDRLPFALFGRRDAASISLVSFEAATGALKVVDGPVRFEAVLPEDVVFDDAGAMIAVVSYHERSDAPKAAWAELFAVDRSGATPQVRPTGVRWPLPRGAHDLAVVRATAAAGK